MYAHNVKVDVVGNDVQGSVMYPTTMINGTIANPYVFLANHTYIVNDQLLLVSECEFQRGTKVYISPNSSVVIYGNVSVSGTSGHVWVSSADSLFGRRMKTTIDCFDKLSFMGDYDYDIEDFIVTFGTNGVNVSGHTAHVTGCLFRNMISAGLVSQSESIFVSNSLFIDNSDKGIYSINDTNIQRIVMIRNHNGIYLNDAFGQIASSYFYDNFIAIRPTYQGVSIVGNCLLDNKYGVSLSASNSTISSNIFSHNEVALETNRSYVGVGSYAYCSPTLSDNNFYGTDVYISLKGQNPVGTGISNATGVNANQHYPDNYFESNELTYHLIDSNHPGSGVLYSINYLPRRLAANPSAGIQ
ncbi:MAG: hypothetical protein PHY48_14615, partial [Candidatus Cloacimonetes bacterium]|nr:hypothetical protein [Candidatus Cloacimonadota bacterium]